jgi:hypothetical protein
MSLEFLLLLRGKGYIKYALNGHTDRDETSNHNITAAIKTITPEMGNIYVYVVLISVMLQCKCEILLTEILITWHYFNFSFIHYNQNCSVDIATG